MTIKIQEKHKIKLKCKSKAPKITVLSNFGVFPYMSYFLNRKM
jgi:hypothetical protein